MSEDKTLTIVYTEPKINDENKDSILYYIDGKKLNGQITVNHFKNKKLVFNNGEPIEIVDKVVRVLGYNQDELMDVFVVCDYGTTSQYKLTRQELIDLVNSSDHDTYSGNHVYVIDKGNNLVSGNKYINFMNK
ncbi:hypothetical protein [Sporolactobacillus putidus]|uniref:Uncharacterized protein n=1 Tax=Sporolactobacillus putidus TaxID=492735 RepID=A0A917S3N8_9BACL|nr:hypothetical protein [Sporolactobacillus putidus]GGL55848.1 hypothetical protein GCM10007968_19920 [Sporolactobacillus putidus]